MMQLHVLRHLGRISLTIELVLNVKIVPLAIAVRKSLEAVEAVQCRTGFEALRNKACRPPLIDAKLQI